MDPWTFLAKRLAVTLQTETRIPATLYLFFTTSRIELIIAKSLCVHGFNNGKVKCECHQRLRLTSSSSTYSVFDPDFGEGSPDSHRQSHSHRDLLLLITYMSSAVNLQAFVGT